MKFIETLDGDLVDVISGLAIRVKDSGWRTLKSQREAHGKMTYKQETTVTVGVSVKHLAFEPVARRLVTAACTFDLPVDLDGATRSEIEGLVRWAAKEADRLCSESGEYRQAVAELRADVLARVTGGAA